MSNIPLGEQLARLVAQIDFNSERYYNLYFESAADLPPQDVTREAWTSLSSLTTDLTKIRGELSRLRLGVEQLRLPAIEAVGLDRVADQLRNLETRLLPLSKATARDEEENQVKRILKDLLGVADALDRVHELAQQQPETVSEGVRRGLDSVQQLLSESFRRHGLEPVAAGDKFDPQVHMAMGTEPNPKLSDGAVSRVLLKGYLFHGQVFRTAQVVVVKNERN